MFKKVIYNTSSQIVGKVLTASTSLIVTLLIARVLGLNAYGEFTKIFVYVAYFYTFCDFGLNALFIKLSTKENLQKNYSTLIGLRILLGVGLALLAMCLTLVLPYNSATNIGFDDLVKKGILIAAFTIITQSLFTTANAMFQRNLRYDFSAIAAAAGSLTTLLVVLLSITLNLPFLLYVAAYVFGGSVATLVAFFIIYKKFLIKIKSEFDFGEFKKMMYAAFPIGVALILNLIYFRIDVFILSATRSTQEVGLYGLAYQFFEAALSIPIFFSNALYPLLSSLKAQSVTQYRKQANKWALLLILFSLGLTLALIVVSLFIPFVFNNPEYEGAKQALQILSLGIPFFFISALLWHMMIIENKQKFLSLIYAIGAAFNLTANIIFIPTNGYIAASYITVASEALITILLFCFLLKGRK